MSGTLRPPPPEDVNVDFEEDTDVDLRCPNCASCMICRGSGHVSLHKLGKLRALLRPVSPHEEEE